MATNRNSFHQAKCDTHILISYLSNPKFSIYHTRLNRDCDTLKNNNWIGFEASGRQTYYTNDIGVAHILIQNCSKEQFQKAVTAEAIQFRVVAADELEKLPGRAFSFKLLVDKVLKKLTIELKASSPTVNQTVKPNL